MPVKLLRYLASNGISINNYRLLIDNGNHRKVFEATMKNGRLPSCQLFFFGELEYDEFVNNVLAKECAYIVSMQKWIESTGSV
jgi:hypothetical protein